jgi:hypothetical protein
MKLIIASAALVLVTVWPAHAAKLNQADCSALWNSSQPKGSDLDEERAKPYVTDFKAVDTNSDGRISSDEFYAGCEKGLVHAAGDTTKTKEK